MNKDSPEGVSVEEREHEPTLNGRQADGIPENVAELEDDYDFPSLLPIDSVSHSVESLMPLMKASSVFSNIAPDEFNNLGR